MTNPEIELEVPLENPDPDPVPVRVIQTVRPVQESPPLYGSYITIPIGATDAPVKLAGQDTGRYRVLVWSDAKVLIGTQKGITANQGATLAAGQPAVEIRNQQEVWAASTGAPANISVVVERVVTPA